MTPERKEELEVALRAMVGAVDRFYAGARRIGVHPFVELAGLMNEQVVMYRAMLREGEDFFLEDLRGEPFNFAYIGEKLDCIYGVALLNPARRAAFLEALQMPRNGASPR